MTAGRTAAELPDDIRSLVVEGREAWRARDYSTAKALLGDALPRARANGHRFAEVAALHFLGNVAFNECRDEEFRRLHGEALAYSKADGDYHGIATSLGNLAPVDVAIGDLDSAGLKFEEFAEAYERIGMHQPTATLRATANAFLVEHVPIESRVDRQPPE
jgi:hypothetical protein